MDIVRAVCRNEPEVAALDWFADRNSGNRRYVRDTISACKAACHRCPIKADCLSDALGDGDRPTDHYGVRGGMTARERAAVLRWRKSQVNA